MIMLRLNCNIDLLGSKCNSKVCDGLQIMLDTPTQGVHDDHTCHDDLFLILL